MAKNKGEIEIDKTFAILLGIIALAVLAYILVNLSSNSTSLFTSLFKAPTTTP